jgi:glucose/arabinose dehydrogenase
MPLFRPQVIGRFAALALPALLVPSALAQFTLNTTRIASGLSRPVYVTAPPGDTSRIFVLEQRTGSTSPATGRIRIINLPANTLNATPYLSIGGLAAGNEQGLLGMTFHPNFLQNGYFYVHTTIAAQSGVSAGSVVITRYRANPPYATSTTADPASAAVLLTVLEPDSNHNTGWIAFGPDGNLYIPLGDGGCGNDTNCTNPASVNPPGHTPGTGNAQDLTDNLLGKILRLDVDGPDNIPGNADDADPANGKPYRIPAGNPFNGTNGDREIWAFGVRNPWRDSFDRLTGDLWIADVGQDAREEVNFVPNGSGAGWNFGWRCMEGNRCTGLAGCTCNAASLTLPVLEYVHTGQTVIPPFTIQGCSLTGGYVYRGNAIPCFRGHYIFADYCSGDIWSFRRLPNGSLADITNRTAQMAPGGGFAINNVTSFGEDASGELYICDQSGGEIFKIIPGSASGTDCNNNGVPDSCDIANGTSTDANGNGVPDECECDTDFNQDGNADQDDVAYLINVISGGGNPTGRDPDFTGDGNTDQDDIAALINAVGGGGCP